MPDPGKRVEFIHQVRNGSEPSRRDGKGEQLPNELGFEGIIEVGGTWKVIIPGTSQEGTIHRGIVSPAATAQKGLGKEGKGWKSEGSGSRAAG